MNFIIDAADWIMIVSGVLTATMVHAAIAPRSALRSMFGETLEGPVAEIIVRNWGALITLVGLALVFAGLTDAFAVPVLILAIVSKLIFIALVLSLGSRYLRRPVGLAIAVDAVFVILFAIILIGLTD